MLPLVPLQQLRSALAEQKRVQVLVQREDLVHRTRSGNKLYKLCFNIQYAKQHGMQTLVSFGGGYSNHLHALALAGQEEGMNTVGIIRGDYRANLTATLRDCQAAGMQVRFVDRQQWALRNTSEYCLSLHADFSNAYIIPEGGDNALGFRGTRLLGQQIGRQLQGLPPSGCTHVLVACGTGTTMAGIVAEMPAGVAVLGVSPLKGDDKLTAAISAKLVQASIEPQCSWKIDRRFCLEGYGRLPNELERFIRFFERKFMIPLDPVYTAKVMFALFTMLEADEFQPGDRVIVIHTGGLQGKRGYPKLMSPLHSSARLKSINIGAF